MTTESIPDTQKAWLIVRKGEPANALKIDEAYPVPKKLGKDEVLVKIQAAAFNPVGYKMIGMLPNFIARRPHVPEHDFAGVVVDANGTEYENGQEVYGWIPLPRKISSKQGTFCEYARLPSRLIQLKPSHLKVTEAAGLGLVGATAYRALFHDLKLQPGQSIFINGGSTSVGIIAIQVAKSLGCTVTATASGKNEEFLKSLGVDKFIDYTKGPVHEQLVKDPPSPKFHAFLEAVGTSDPTLYLRSEAYLAPGAVFASVGPQPSLEGGYIGVARLILALCTPGFLGGVKRKWALVQVDDRFDEWKEFSKYVTDGKAKPVIDSVFSFEDALKGYERIMSSRAVGKVVVKVDPTVE